MLYKTTSDFLEAFGLNSLDDLPAVDLDALQPRDIELPMTQALVEAPEETPPDEAPETPPDDQEAGALSLA